MKRVKNGHHQMMKENRVRERSNQWLYQRNHVTHWVTISISVLHARWLLRVFLFSVTITCSPTLPAFICPNWRCELFQGTWSMNNDIDPLKVNSYYIRQNVFLHFGPFKNPFFWFLLALLLLLLSRLLCSGRPKNKKKEPSNTCAIKMELKQ